MTAELTVIVESRFPLGNLVATPQVLKDVPQGEIQTALTRHCLGDWGEVDEHDKAVNDAALENGDRLFSVYTSVAGIKFWIITEWDRSATTVLLPEDY